MRAWKNNKLPLSALSEYFVVLSSTSSPVYSLDYHRVKYCQVLVAVLYPLERSDFEFMKFWGVFLDFDFQFSLFHSLCFPPFGALSVVILYVYIK